MVTNKRKAEMKKKQKTIAKAALSIMLASVVGIAAIGTGNFVRQQIARQNTSIAIERGNNEALANQINNMTKVIGGYNHFIALTADGKVYGWGLNNNGQFGIGGTANRLSPYYLNINDAIDIGVGANFTLVLKRNGTVWSAGNNGSGQLGRGKGNTTASSTWVPVMDKNGSPLQNIKQICATSDTSYALSNDGEVYIWGYNGYGQMGNNGTSNQYVPYKTSLTGIQKIAAGNNNSLALTNDGKVYVAGYNDYRQLGVGEVGTFYNWRLMKDQDGKTDLTGVKDISSGQYHTILLKTDGSVYTVGHNGQGQLGNGNNTQYGVIQRIVTKDGNPITGVKKVLARGRSSYIVTQNGELYTTGQNNYGQLGIQNTTNQNKFVKVDTQGKKIVHVAGTKNDGNSTTIWIDEIGRIYSVRIWSQWRIRRRK